VFAVACFVLLPPACLQVVHLALQARLHVVEADPKAHPFLAAVVSRALGAEKQQGPETLTTRSLTPHDIPRRSAPTAGARPVQKKNKNHPRH